MSMYVRNAGVWTPVPSGGLYVRNAGAWTPVRTAWVRNAGSWDLFYQLTDPVTVTLAPDWVQTYMFNGSKAVTTVVSGVASDDAVQGFWDVSQSDPAGNWSHVTTVMSFQNIGDYLAARPVLKSATLRMGLRVGYGGTPLDSRLVLGGTTVSGGEPASLAHTDAAKGLQETTGTIWTAQGQVKSVALNAAMLDSIQNLGRYGVALHDESHGTSETRKRQTRTVWYGRSAASNLAPRLTITVDYL